MPERAWVLNLDADLELEAGRAVRPSARVGAAVARAREELARTLPAGDVVVGGADARGLEGRAWCPTPSALRKLGDAGARVPPAPPLEVLRCVNERGFAHAVGHLPGTLRCTRRDEVREAIARPGRWLLKRGFGFAGRGQRRVDGGAATAADLAWIAASLRRGALYVEPRVAIELEVALHGNLEPQGSLERGAPVVSRVEHGAWRASRLARPDELSSRERGALLDAFERSARALTDAGYFGSFGIDAYRYDGGFCALGEINARYTMGWGTGMGGFR